jgi:hypothetical protein
MFCDEIYHELRAANAIWEAGIILNVRSRCQLSTCCNAVCKEPFIEHSCSRFSSRLLIKLEVNLRFNSALARYTAAVCAAGPEPMTIQPSQYTSSLIVALCLSTAL